MQPQRHDLLIQSHGRIAAFFEGIDVFRIHRDPSDDGCGDGSRCARNLKHGGGPVSCSVALVSFATRSLMSMTSAGQNPTRGPRRFSFTCRRRLYPDSKAAGTTRPISLANHGQYFPTKIIPSRQTPRGSERFPREVCPQTIALENTRAGRPGTPIGNRHETQIDRRMPARPAPRNHSPLSGRVPPNQPESIAIRFLGLAGSAKRRRAQAHANQPPLKRSSPGKSRRGPPPHSHQLQPVKPSIVGASEVSAQ